MFISSNDPFFGICFIRLSDGDGEELETSGFQIFHGGNLTFINSFDETNFFVALSHRRSTTVSLETRILFGKIIQYTVSIIHSLSPYRMLQEKLEEPMSEPPSPRQFRDGEDVVGDLASHITSLREEIRRLRQQLAQSEADCEYENGKKKVYTTIEFQNLKYLWFHLFRICLNQPKALFSACTADAKRGKWYASELQSTLIGQK